MKSHLSTAAIVAACKLAEVAIADERNRINAIEDARCAAVNASWWGRLFRLRLVAKPSLSHQQQLFRILNLQCLARHKMRQGILEVEDPHLSDIATFLDFDEAETTRI